MAAPSRGVPKNGPPHPRPAAEPASVPPCAGPAGQRCSGQVEALQAGRTCTRREPNPRPLRCGRGFVGPRPARTNPHNPAPAAAAWQPRPRLGLGCWTCSTGATSLDESGYDSGQTFQSHDLPCCRLFSFVADDGAGKDSRGCRERPPWRSGGERNATEGVPYRLPSSGA